MKTGSIVALVVVIGLLIGVMGGCSYVKGKYNHANQQSIACDENWAEVQSAYQRRADLIPNLVATVQGSANFEQKTLTDISKAQSSIGSARVEMTMAGGAPVTQADIDNFASRQQTLGSALSRLMAVQYKFPDLKTTERFAELQAQVEGTENRIKYARDNYNVAVKTFNTYIGNWIVPPFNLKSFGWVDKPFFKTQSTEAETAPKINFGSTPEK